MEKRNACCKVLSQNGILWNCIGIPDWIFVVAEALELLLSCSSESWAQPCDNCRRHLHSHEITCHAQWRPKLSDDRNRFAVWIGWTTLAQKNSWYIIILTTSREQTETAKKFSRSLKNLLRMLANSTMWLIFLLPFETVALTSLSLTRYGALFWIAPSFAVISSSTVSDFYVSI